MTDKKEYYFKIDRYLELIRLKEAKISKLKQKIYKLNNELKGHEASCDHIDENGESAFEDSSYWVSDISTYVNHYTDEVETHNGGYTQYEETCKICNYEREE